MSGIHDMRRLYESSPRAAKEVVGRAARMLPERVRYGRAFAETRDLLAAAKGWDVECYDAAQRQRLSALCDAAHRTLYWRSIFDACGLPNGPQCLAELQLLPTLDKDTVRSETEKMLDRETPEMSRKWVTTGGTTGVPLGLWIDKDASVADWAFVIDAWSRAGFVLDDRRVVLRGRRLGRGEERRLFEYEPIRRELYVSAFDLDERSLPAIRDRIRKFKPLFIHGYPSAIEYLGRSYVAAGEQPPDLKALLTVSEALLPLQRQMLEAVFGCRTFSFYGMTEKGAFAAECEHSNDLHCDPLYGVVEIVGPDGLPIAEPGAEGEIVVTGLLSRCMPLFRYRTGDRGSWAEGRCPCGRPHRRLKAVVGRWSGDDLLVGRSGARITMTALNVHSPVFDAILRFRFVQERSGEATLLVVPGPTFDATAREALLAELRGKLEGQVDLTLREVSEIPLTSLGKHRFVDQKVAL